MPTRPAASNLCLPTGLIRVCRFPKSEVARVFLFVLVGIDALTAAGATVVDLDDEGFVFPSPDGEFLVLLYDFKVDIAKYFQSDLLFYRAGHPAALVAREAAHWDPLLFWAADTLGAHFILAEGIVHVRQPDSAIAAARAALPTNAWSIAALHVVTTLTGSALLALALMRGVIDQDQAWAAAHVDEDWNIEQWGGDEEVAARRAARLVDFRAAATVLKSTA